MKPGHGPGMSILVGIGKQKPGESKEPDDTGDDEGEGYSTADCAKRLAELIGLDESKASDLEDILGEFFELKMSEEQDEGPASG